MVFILIRKVIFKIHKMDQISRTFVNLALKIVLSVNQEHKKVVQSVKKTIILSQFIKI